MKKKVLLIGSGGREHALAWKIQQSSHLDTLYIAPGNAGTMHLGQNVAIEATDISALVDFAKTNSIDLVVVGPDDPLSMGIVDAFHAVEIPVFGPTKAAARLESSKAFAKDFMRRNGIPTARYEIFTDFESAVAYVEEHPYPLVIKASGLALGKGVVIAENKEEALVALRQSMVEKLFGDAGTTVVIEEFLVGPEVSIHVFSDGKTWRLFPSSQDHKRAHEDDKGLNTGGMGTVAPLPFVSRELLALIDEKIVTPTLRAMATEGMPFVGVLFPGLMLTKEGPKVLEFNTRFGDPETQSYMRLLDTDIIDIFDACTRSALHTVDIRWKKLFACNIVIASGGYPGKYEKGIEINGIANASNHDGVVVFHAGTVEKDGKIVTNGGRVLGVSALAQTLPEALKSAYEAVSKIHFAAMQYRKDIGKKAMVTERM